MMVVIEQVTLQHLGRCDHRLEPAAHCTGIPQLEKTQSRMRIGKFPKMAKLFFERPGSTHFEIAIEQVPQPGAAPANLATLGNVDPKSVTMRISGLGLVSATCDPDTKLVSYKMSRQVTVIVSAIVNARKTEARWSLNIGSNEDPR